MNKSIVIPPLSNERTVATNHEIEDGRYFYHPQVMFSQVSGCPQGGVCLIAGWDTHLPGTRGRHPPGPEVDTPGSETDTPLARHPSPWQTTPLWADNLPGQTLPGQTPPGRYPLGRHPRAQCMLGDTVDKRAVCIPLECILVLD